MLSTEAMGVGHYLKIININIIIRASKDFSGLVKVTVTSPAVLMKFFLKGALKAHIHISLIYESNILQEQDAAILFLSVIP